MIELQMKALDGSYNVLGVSPSSKIRFEKCSPDHLISCLLSVK